MTNGPPDERGAPADAEPRQGLGPLGGSWRPEVDEPPTMPPPPPRSGTNRLRWAGPKPSASPGDGQAGGGWAGWPASPPPGTGRPGVKPPVPGRRPGTVRPPVAPAPGPRRRPGCRRRPTHGCPAVSAETGRSRGRASAAVAVAALLVTSTLVALGVVLVFRAGGAHGGGQGHQSGGSLPPAVTAFEGMLATSAEARLLSTSWVAAACATSFTSQHGP